MILTKGKSRWVSVFGYVALALGVFDTGAYYVARVVYSAVQDMGIVQGNAALVSLGATTLVIAQNLKRLEKRLEEIERAKDGEIKGKRNPNAARRHQ
jgi:hypothetical protein